MQEPSYMIILPNEEKDIESPDTFMSNLTQCDFIQIKGMNMDEEKGLVMDLLVEGIPYQISIDITDVEVPPFIRPAHVFSEEEIERIDNTKVGLAVCMEFQGSSMQCFYDQIRIIHAMLPDVLAVMDCAAEKLISGRWIAPAAESKVLPAPRYLFTVQAVGDESGEVWLHTHGLGRCGLYELEILCSDKDTCNDHYRMMENFAYRMLDDDEPIEPGVGVFIGESAGVDMVLTAVNWREALNYYPDAIMGTEADRDEYHDDSYVLMMYKNGEDEDNRRYTRVQEFTSFLQDNPLFMISDSETARMRSLAMERIPYMIEAAKDPENTILVKIGLFVDDEYQDEDGEKREHIWFELKDVKEDGIVGELTQEPYYVSGIREGDIGIYPFSDITDWIILTKECKITPDEVYLLKK